MLALSEQGQTASPGPRQLACRCASSGCRYKPWKASPGRARTTGPRGPRTPSPLGVAGQHDLPEQTLWQTRTCCLGQARASPAAWTVGPPTPGPRRGELDGTPLLPPASTTDPPSAWPRQAVGLLLGPAGDGPHQAQVLTCRAEPGGSGPYAARAAQAKQPLIAAKLLATGAGRATPGRR